MLTFIPTPLGNLDDITVRAIECFQNADIILCEDTRVTGQLLSLLAKRREFETRAKLISFHEHNQNRRLQEFDSEFFSQNVLYVSDAGMPAISDPGARLVQFCHSRGLEYDVLPGPSAAVTAYAASGFEGGFYFYGFLPKKKRLGQLQQLLQSSCPVIVYESPHRIQKLLEQIKSLQPRAQLFLAKEISKQYQRYYYGTAESISLANTKGEWTVVIKPVPKPRIELDVEEVIALDISDKQKSKILAKEGEKTAKQWYNELQNRGR